MANTYLKCIQHIYSPVRNNMLIVRGIENIQAHFIDFIVVILRKIYCTDMTRYRITSDREK